MNKLKSNLFKVSMAVLCFLCLAFLFNSFNYNQIANAETNTLSISLNGEGTSTNPYKITNGTDLKNLSIFVNNGNSTSGYYFELTSDIDLNSYSNWTPIGRDGLSYFGGTFNGNGHTISNMKIVVTSQYVGLFGYIGSSATLTNFKMEDVTITGEQLTDTFFAGAVLGYNGGGTVQISKVIVDDGIINISSSNNSNLFVGGIVGYSTNAGLNIFQCWTNMDIVGLTSNIYRGSILSGNSGNIIDCYSLKNLSIVRSDLIIGNNNLLVKYSYYYDDSVQKFTYYTDMSSNYGTYPVYSASDAYTYLRAKSTNWFLSGNELLLKNVGNVYTLTEASITVMPRYFDISTNSWQNGTSNTTTLSLNQIVSNSIANNAISNVSTDYLLAFTTAYFNFNNGSTDIPITTSTFICTTANLEYAEANYTLYVNYTNGKKVSIDNEEHWLCFSNNKLYKKETNTFTEITTANLPAQAEKYFLGYSLENTTIIGEWNGTGWYHDDLLVEAVRSGLTSDPIDYTITGIDFSTLFAQDFTSCSLDNPLAIYSVWGNDNVRANTAVYKVVNGVYFEITNYHIACDSTTTTADYISIEKNQTYDFSIKNSLNIVLNTSTVGYQIAWYIGTFADFENNTTLGSEYGSLSTTNLPTTEFSNATTETNVLVVLTPRTDIGIEILVNEFEGSENITFKLNNEVFTNQTLTYGEVYTITVENIPNGYYLKNATSQSGIVTEFTIDSQTGTITFTVDFNQDISITINIQESIFNNIYFYLMVSIAIATIIIGIWIVVVDKSKISKK